MSEGGFTLSELVVHYPFTPLSRRFFDRLPIEESFSSKEVIRQAENRLLSSIGRVRYEPHLSDEIEFASFFVAALVASQHSYLAQRLASVESGRAKNQFIKERLRDKPKIFRDCFGFSAAYKEDGTNENRLSARIEDYLSFVTKFELSKISKWKLVNQALANGFVYFTENSFNDLFGDSAEKMIYEGVRNLRKAHFPEQLLELRDRILPGLPPPKTRSTKSYLYIEELMKHPVSDGRHRLVWLVLSGYLANVKQLQDDEAVERIREYILGAGETRSMKRFIEYNVKRARRLGLMPPTLDRLKAEHPDLYVLLPREVLKEYSSTVK